MQEGIGVIEASQKAILQRSGGREEIHFLFQGRLQAVQLSRENTAWARRPGQGELHWEVLPEGHGHVQLQGESDPAWGEGNLLSSRKNVMKTAFKLLSLGFSWASSASGSKSCVWKKKGFNTEMYLNVPPGTYSGHYPVSFLTSLPKTKCWNELFRPKCMMDFVKGNGCQGRPGNSFAVLFIPQLWLKGHSGYQKKRVWCELGEAKLLLLPWSLFTPEQSQSEQITCLILIRWVYSCGWASL